MISFDIPPAIKLAIMVSILIALLIGVLLAIGAMLRWGGCWACG